MSVLVLKLSGPLQSWGTELKLEDHGTDTMPSKSGVIGMVAAALGRRRDEDISDLRALRFGARCDSGGRILQSRILRDFQVAHVKSEKSAPYVSRRYYLQDACFTVGLEGDREFLEKCADAMNRPVFPPYLGRRNCVPDPDLVIGIFEGSLEDVLKTVGTGESKEKSRKRICVESYDECDRLRHDNPMSFDFHNRVYAYRMEKDLYIEE